MKRAVSGGKSMGGLPFDQREGVIWYNGEFVPWADAKLHVFSPGLHYASAVFEGERAYGGVIFKLDEHTRRLHESARMLGFEIPYSVETINKACEDILVRQGLSDAYVRPIAWRGSEMMGVSAQSNRINVAVSRAMALTLVFASPRLLDARCATVEEVRLINTLCVLPVTRAPVAFGDAA